MNKGQEFEKSLLKSDYFNDSYFGDTQLYSFVEQIKKIKKILKNYDGLQEIKILEVGKGNGFVSNFIKSMGFSVTTFDINSNLEPDMIGDVLELSTYFNDSCFDLVLCSEVLEHMELNSFEKALSEIRKVSKKYVFITLPEYKSFSGFHFLIRLFNKSKQIAFFLPTKPSYKMTPEHFWEIDFDKNTTRKKINLSLNKFFVIHDSGRFKLNPNHNYFIMEIRNI